MDNTYKSYGDINENMQLCCPTYTPTRINYIHTTKLNDDSLSKLDCNCLQKILTNNNGTYG